MKGDVKIQYFIAWLYFHCGVYWVHYLKNNWRHFNVNVRFFLSAFCLTCLCWHLSLRCCHILSHENEKIAKSIVRFSIFIYYFRIFAIGLFTRFPLVFTLFGYFCVFYTPRETDVRSASGFLPLSSVCYWFVYTFLAQRTSVSLGVSNYFCPFSIGLFTFFSRCVYLICIFCICSLWVNF